MSSTRRAVAVPCGCLVLLLALVAGCARKDATSPVAASQAPPAPGAAAPAPPPVPDAGPGREVEGAKQLVAKLASVNKMEDLPPLLSNDTAATIGVAMGAMVLMVASMAEGFAGMAEGMAKGMGAKPGAASQAKAKRAAEEMKKTRLELEALFKRYDLDLTGSATGASPDLGKQTKLRGDGRRFLVAVLGMLDRLAKDPSSGMETSKEPGKMIVPATARYTVLGPGRVRIEAKDGEGKASTMEARVEEGGWRLHAPELSQVFQPTGPGGAVDSPR